MFLRAASTPTARCAVAPQHATAAAPACQRARACPTAPWPGCSSARPSCCCWRSTSFRCSGPIWLSFTNFRANRPDAEVAWVGIGNYERVLNDEAIWENMQATAHFLVWSITLQLLLGFGLALLLNRRFRSAQLLEHR